MNQKQLPFPHLPDKLYFKIGEVSQLADVPPYVLRFWETEFSRIKPSRSESGQRLYRRKDVERILMIKHLLYDRKFTIQGAKQYLIKNKTLPSVENTASKIEIIRQELLQIRKLLS